MAGNINLVDYNSATAFWTFMIYCLVVVFVAVFFLFFASRVFAQLLSKLIRWFTWRHLKAYIEFGKGTPLKNHLVSIAVAASFSSLISPLTLHYIF
jgi:hypothetical protein